MVVADALYYNAPLAVAALAQQGALTSFLGLWFGMIFAAKKSGKGKHFRRMHDKKVEGGGEEGGDKDHHFTCTDAHPSPPPPAICCLRSQPGQRPY